MTETTYQWRAPPRRSSHRITTRAVSVVWVLTALVVTVAVVLGGGARQGRWSDAIVQLVSLGLLVVLVFRNQYRWRDVDRLTLTVLTAVILLPLLQLIRLPPSLWTALPGRETFALAYDVAGIELPWLPISLDPAATWRSWLGLLPAIAVFLATITLGRRERRNLSFLVLALGMLTVLVGLAQLMQGPSSPLRLYPFSPNASAGFFADSNHHAVFLTILIPLVAAWAVGIVHDRHGRRGFGLAVCLLAFAVLILGVSMAGSRAGVFLASLAAIASLFLIPRGQRLTRYSLSAIAAAAAVGVILAIHFAFVRIVGSFDTSILADLRFMIADVTASAVWTYFPVGTGLGTFQEIYQIFEPNESLRRVFINRAHNDWLESLLEGGILSIGVMLAFIAWFVSRSYRAWTPRGATDHAFDKALAQAASVAILLLLLFSLVEYPLRSTTLSVIFAWLAALLIDPLPASPSTRGANTTIAERGPRRHRPHPRRRPTWART